MPPSNPSMSIAARPPAQRLEGFRMVWPESQVVNNEGRTSLDDLRSNPTTPEVPQFGFNTNFHFDQFPILHGALDAPQPVGGPNVATVPPGNHPYAAFSDDSPWQITYDGVLYLEQILRCPTHGSRLTNYGLFSRHTGTSSSGPGHTRTGPTVGCSGQLQRPARDPRLLDRVALDACIFGGPPSFECDGQDGSTATVVLAVARPLHAVCPAKFRGTLQISQGHCGGHLRVHGLDVGPQHADLVRSTQRHASDPERRASELLLQTASVTPVRSDVPRCSQDVTRYSRQTPRFPPRRCTGLLRHRPSSERTIVLLRAVSPFPATGTRKFAEEKIGAGADTTLLARCTTSHSTTLLTISFRWDWLSVFSEELAV